MSEGLNEKAIVGRVVQLSNKESVSLPPFLDPTTTQCESSGMTSDDRDTEIFQMGLDAGTTPSKFSDTELRIVALQAATTKGASRYSAEVLSLAKAYYRWLKGV